MANIPNLPVELQDLVFADIEGDALLALSVTAKVLYALAMPRVYRKISLTDYDRILLLLRTLKKSDTLVNLVTHLELHWQRSSTDAVATLVGRLGTVLPRLVNLVHLKVSGALGIFYWVFDQLELPSLRYFHSFTYVNVAFLQRHPHLYEATLKEPTFKNATETANLLEPRVLRLLGGGPEQLLKVCSDGQPRPTLRRIDWVGKAAPPHFDHEALHRITSFVTQVNYLNGCSELSPPLNPPWTSVKRIGIRIEWWHWLTVFVNELAHALSDAVRSFPNVDTLDIHIDQITNGEGVMTRWSEIEGVLFATQNLKRVTLNGTNWTRSTPTVAFKMCITGSQPDDTPDLRVNFSS